MALNQQDIFTQSNSLDPAFFLDQVDFIRTEFQKSLDKERQAEMGQFLTRPSIAKMMAGMFTHFPEKINLVDPGAGVGSLSAAFISSAIQADPRPQSIHISAYELDPLLKKGLEITRGKCQQLCDSFGVELLFEIRQQDFIASGVEILLGRNSLFSVEQPGYNFAIMNPPYKKINSGSKARQLLNAVGIETTNMYSAFMWLVMELLLPEGAMVAIVPRSFCNGSYFRPFRSALLKMMAINRIHLFESRDKAFDEGDVLQENIIIHALKKFDHNQKTLITSNDHPGDETIVVREVEFNQLVHPNDPDLFLRIVPDQLGHQINNQVNSLPSSLKDLGITVSTGRVVDFRSRTFLRNEPDDEIIPLIYPGNLHNGQVIWPRLNSKKPSWLASSKDVDQLVIPGQYYVLVKRFSSKEERRRIYAAIYNPRKIAARRVGIENHINYYHKRYGSLSEELAKGLTIYLNSSLVDQFFRQFSGHTQVNATDLRNLKYPSETQLIALGSRFEDEFPNQDEIDQMIAEVLALNEKGDEKDIQDPIRAKKKIREALSILQKLGVPKAQQNDRSALTLLALANIRATSEWKDASDSLMGITEMMDYFKEYYGVAYAPNTRETVRRQSVHQFLQLGLAIANPDDPSRPINSPKTRYTLESNTLELLRTFGSTNWELLLKEYLRKAPSLGALQVRERTMTMIPVTLPDGENLLLTCGGQNELIKKIIEEFCPRFTPGGKILYIGDAGEKLNEKEIQYFVQMGLKLDKHGKMPDLIVSLAEKKWLVLIEAVTSHGPIDLKRHNELRELFSGGAYGLVFVTAFESRKAMHKYLPVIAWETEVWVAESPTHLIHFNGERFLGPYSE
jgi:adenine-specific DNA-methyltransferase